MRTENAEVVADPVSHISISGVHGRDELNRRLARSPAYRNGNGRADGPVRALLVGVVIGAVVMAFLKR